MSEFSGSGAQTNRFKTADEDLMKTDSRSHSLLLSQTCIVCTSSWSENTSFKQM